MAEWFCCFGAVLTDLFRAEHTVLQDLILNVRNFPSQTSVVSVPNLRTFRLKHPHFLSCFSALFQPVICRRMSRVPDMARRIMVTADSGTAWPGCESPEMAVVRPVVSGGIPAADVMKAVGNADTATGTGQNVARVAMLVFPHFFCSQKYDYLQNSANLS